MKRIILAWISFFISAIGYAQTKDLPQDGPTNFAVSPPVIYPRESRLAREEGKVTLRVVVEKTGLPSSVVVLKSSGFQRLDQAAVAAYFKARFIPYVLNGEPIRIAATGTISFVMDGENTQNSKRFEPAIMQCGQVQFEIKRKRTALSTPNGYEEIFGEFSNGAPGQRFLYRSPIGARISQTCVNDVNEKPLLLIQVICTRSDCGILKYSQYGIVDAMTMRVSLQPGDGSQGNAAKAEQIIGKSLSATPKAAAIQH